MGVSLRAFCHGEHQVAVGLEGGHLVKRRSDDQLESQPFPGTDRTSGELGVGFYEALIKEDRREPRVGTLFVAELVAERGPNDEGNEFLGLPAALAAEGQRMWPPLPRRRSGALR